MPAVQTLDELMSNLIAQWVAFSMIVKREMFREWQYTIVAPLVTLVLYLIVFGPVFGDRVGAMGGVAYIDYIFPGLLILAIVLNAYNSSALSFYLDKFLFCHQQWLTASVYIHLVLFAFAVGCALRSLILLVMLWILGMVFGALPVINDPIKVACVVTCTSLIFSFAGIVNAMLANSFDQIAYIPNLLLIPLTFLGGVFYDISLLTPNWRLASLANPVLYMVDSMRAGMHTNNLFPFWISLLLLLALLGTSSGIATWMATRGVGMKP